MNLRFSCILSGIICIEFVISFNIHHHIFGVSLDHLFLQIIVFIYLFESRVFNEN